LIGRPSQEALHDLPIGLAFRQRRGISILVHRGGDVRVSHEFLLNAHGCSRFVQPSTVGVAERGEMGTFLMWFQGDTLNVVQQGRTAKCVKAI